MARTPSGMVPLGTKAPYFSLPDTITDKQISLEAIKGGVATVVMFICNHCPFVKHVNAELVKLANDYKDRGVGLIAISANDAVSHPEDAPDKMKEMAQQLDYPFPYCYDETQEVAKAYGAACTPDFFIYNKDLELVYRGQLDDSRPGNEMAVNGRDMRRALDCLINNKVLAAEQRPSVGCNIKWK